MVLQLSKEKALEILNKRLVEIDASNFDHKKWIAKICNDLTNILPLFGNEAAYLQCISFENAIGLSAVEAEMRGKEQVRSHLKTIIEKVSDYGVSFPIKSKIDYKVKYNRSEEEKAGIVRELNETQDLLDEAEVRNLRLNQEIGGIKQNTDKFDNITVKKLFKLFGYLTIEAAGTFFGGLIMLCGFFLWAGDTISDTSAKNEQYELKVERNKLKTKNDSLIKVNRALEDQLRNPETKKAPR